MPGNLSTEELSLLRTGVESWFTDTCDVYRITKEDDEYGGEGETETRIQIGVPCMLETGAAHEQVRALMGKLQGVELVLVSLPAGTDVNVEDHLVLTSQSNMHLRVQAVMDPESYEVERRVVASTQGEHHA